MSGSEITPELQELMDNIVEVRFGKLKSSIRRMQEMEGEAASRALYFLLESLEDDKRAHRNIREQLEKALLKRKDIVYFWILSKQENVLGEKLTSLMENLPAPTPAQWDRILEICIEKREAGWNEDTRQMAERMLEAAIGDMAKDGRVPVMGRLRELARSGGAEGTRLSALRALAKKKDPETIGQIVEMALGSDQKAAVLGINFLGEASARNAFRDSNWSAIAGLAGKQDWGEGEKELAKRSVKEALKDMSFSGRPSMIEILRRAGKESKWEFLKLYALKVLVRRNDPYVFDEIKELAGSRDRKRAVIGINLLSEIASPTNFRVADAIKEMLEGEGGKYCSKKEPVVRAALVELLGNFLSGKPNRELISMVQKVAMDDKNPSIRGYALNILGGHGNMCTDFLENFCRRDTDDPGVVRDALDALHRVGTPKARKAVERLVGSRGLADENKRYAKRLLGMKWQPSQVHGLQRPPRRMRGRLMEKVSGAEPVRLEVGKKRSPDSREITLHGMKTPVGNGSPAK